MVTSKLGKPSVVIRRLRDDDYHRWWVLYPDKSIVVEVTMAEAYEQMEIVGLAIIPPSLVPDVDHWLGSPKARRPTVITAELLRAVPLAKLKAACLADLNLTPETPPLLATLRVSPKRGQAPVPIETISTAAQIYRDAERLQEDPIPRIVAEMAIKEPTARKYVKRARDLGLLGYPDRPGVAGSSSSHSPITGRSAGPSSEEGSQQ